MSMNSLRSHLSFVKRGATLYRYPSQYLSGSSREPPASALGELMVTIRASPPDQSPQTSYCTIVLFGSQVISLVRLTGLPAFNSVHPRRIRCRSQHRGMGYHPLRMKISMGLPPSGVVTSWQPCLPGQPWVSGLRSTDFPVPSPRG